MAGDAFAVERGCGVRSGGTKNQPQRARINRRAFPFNVAATDLSMEEGSKGPAIPVGLSRGMKIGGSQELAPPDVFLGYIRLTFWGGSVNRLPPRYCGVKKFY